MRQLTRSDYDECDLMFGMDQANIPTIRRICGDDLGGKTRLLMEYTNHPGDVAAPWYTDDFDTT